MHELSRYRRRRRKSSRLNKRSRCSRVAVRRSPGKNDSLSPLLVAAIPVTRSHGFFGLLLAIFFQRATDIVTFFDTAFAVATNVPSIALWFNGRAFPAGFFCRHNTGESPPNAFADVG